MASLTIGLSGTCAPLILWALRNAISSRELVGGHTPHVLPVGPTPAPCGPALAPVNRSRSPVKARASKTKETCGPRGLNSSVPPGPLSSWENRLRERLALHGSPERGLTWKALATPHGPSLSRLAPSRHPTNANDCGLWPTPTLPSGGQKPPAGTTPTGRTLDGRKVQVTLANVAEAALWPTPTAMDNRRGLLPPRRTDTGLPLTQMVGREVHRAMWATPLSSNARSGLVSPEVFERNSRPLQEQAAVFGAVLGGSTVPTENSGVLHPALPCWLMGYDLVTWLEASPDLAMRSCLKSPPKYLGPISTPTPTMDALLA